MLKLITFSNQIFRFRQKSAESEYHVYLYFTYRENDEEVGVGEADERVSEMVHFDVVRITELTEIAVYNISSMTQSMTIFILYMAFIVATYFYSVSGSLVERDCFVIFLFFYYVF